MEHMNYAKYILLALNRKYPPQRLTMVKIYHGYFTKMGIPFRLFVADSKSDDERIVRAGSASSPSLFMREALFAFRLMQYVIRHRKEIRYVHLINPVLFCQTPILSARLVGVPIVFDLRSAPIMANPFKYVVLWLLDVLSLLFCSRIVVLCKKMLEEKYGGFFLGKSVELPLGFVPREPTADRDIGADNVLKFVMPTTLHRTRRLEVIFEAFKGLPQHHLYLYGDGPELAELKSAYGGWPNIHLMGYCPYEELVDKLPEFDCGVAFIPRTPYYEYQPPLKTIEYLGAGLPVIATNTYGNRIYVNEQNGVLIDDTTEALRQALVEMKPADYDRGRIRRGVERYKWDTILQSVFESELGL